jgi:hypothetical protein
LKGLLRLVAAAVVNRDTNGEGLLATDTGSLCRQDQSLDC